MAENAYDRAVWKKLAALRLRKGLAQKDLANLAGVHFTTVSCLERGARGASPAVIKALADVLEVDAAELERSRPPVPARPRRTDELGVAS